MSKRRSCEGDPNSYCYVCAKGIPLRSRANIPADPSSVLYAAYEAYFKSKLIRDPSKNWTPKITCKTCYTNLLRWYHNKGPGVKMIHPMIWVEPVDHDKDCYFCFMKKESGQYNFQIYDNKRQSSYTGNCILPVFCTDNSKLPPSPELISDPSDEDEEEDEEED